MNKYFFCYDPLLHVFLHTKNGIPFITRALHEKTHNKFWLYERNEQLNELINKYHTYFK